MVLAILAGMVLPTVAAPVSASPAELKWSIIGTPAPGQESYIIVTPSEINAIAIGANSRTFYAIDIAHSEIYKSSDGGITWRDELSGYLAASGATLPVWDVVVAPDDSDFVAVVTTIAGSPGAVFISTDGGTKWYDAGLGAVDDIGAIDISVEYGNGKRDIAIGTRTGTGTGKVYAMQAPGFGSWEDQGLTGDVTALKFSSTYSGDSTIVVISSTTGTFLNLGSRDIPANDSTWNTYTDYPVEIVAAPFPGGSPTAAEIITADLELPSDFSGTTSSLRRYYISIDTTAVGAQFGVYRIDDTDARKISTINRRISSIAYRGTYTSGKLLVGEVITDADRGQVDIWRSFSSELTFTNYYKSDGFKSPTGGGNSGYANAKVVWSPDGGGAYCVTSSASLTTAADWPGTDPDTVPDTGDETGYLFSQPLDESALSVTWDDGNVWNQISLIDTETSFLSDAAVSLYYEEDEEFQTLYLASINNNATVTYNFDSVWRSTSYIPGERWVRVLCADTSDSGTIIRINSRASEEKARSDVIVFADRFTENISYSPDEGQRWQSIYPSVSVTDLSLASDDDIYVLDDTFVRRGFWTGSGWSWASKVPTELDSGHTITTPLENPNSEGGDGDADWVIVGDASYGEVAYADFSQVHKTFELTPAVPVPGNIHVLMDDQFEQNKIIYAASDDPGGAIYRWIFGTSTDWEEIESPNSSFYGLVKRNGALYGVWDIAVNPAIVTDEGVDRTLYSQYAMPPPLEWDDLTAGLPDASDANYPVSFTREPSALKISANEDNHLWAIDNRDYDWEAEEGCLWAYTDTLARSGPWTTAPSSGEFIPVDPVSGRADQINFKWRELDNVEAYDFQLAKDEGFALRVISGNVTEFIVPDDPLWPTWILPPGHLEDNHVYYWRVRASRSYSGEVIRSPWSAVMSFMVKVGLRARSEYLGPTLLCPAQGADNVTRSPAFSWSPLHRVTGYEFILAENSDLTQIVAKADVSSTAYEYTDELDWGATYFWQVRAIEPFESEPSPVAAFRVAMEEEPVPPPLPLSTPFWIWAVIAIYAALVAAIIALIKLGAARGDEEDTAYMESKVKVDNPDSALARSKGTMAVMQGYLGDKYKKATAIIGSFFNGKLRNTFVVRRLGRYFRS